MLIAQSTFLLMIDSPQLIMLAIASAIATIGFSFFNLRICNYTNGIAINRWFILSTVIAFIGWSLSTFALFLKSNDQTLIFGMFFVCSLVSCSFVDGVIKKIYAPTVVIMMLSALALFISQMPLNQDTVLRNLFYSSMFWLLWTILLKPAVADEFVFLSITVALISFDLTIIVIFFLVFIGLIFMVRLLLLKLIEDAHRAQVALVPFLNISFCIAIQFM